MFDHVEFHVADRLDAERRYTELLSVLEIHPSYVGDDLVEWEDFGLVQASVRHPQTTGVHVGLVAPSRSHVDRFWRAGLELGFDDDGAPGPRTKYSHDYYGGFLRDDDGNSVEAVHRSAMRVGGHVDHLWIRVADVAAARDFYAVMASHAGFALSVDETELARFRGSSGSFTVVTGSPLTENLHMAFGVTEDEVIGAWHAEAVGAGYRSNGGPGERPQYHDGYYAAFVFDPDGNNIELVNHHR
jgi:catechol 2,3-dioxygenase-like lactoylglutathione lyase family enzyme